MHSRRATTSISPSGRAPPPRSSFRRSAGRASSSAFPGEAGSFTSGGTISNLTALTAARERARARDPRMRRLRRHAPRPLLLAEVHYSVVRAAELLGIGSSWVRALPIDERAAAASRRGRRGDRRRSRGTAIVPVAVVATAGTTLTGAVDPIEELADSAPSGRSGCTSTAPTACRRRADPPPAPLFRGVERADSVTIDAHKWLYLPKACGVVLVRHRGRPRSRARPRGLLPPARPRGGCTPRTSRSSIRGPSGRSSSGSRSACTVPTAFLAEIERNLDQASSSTARVVEQPRAGAAPVRAAALDRPLPPRPRGRQRPRCAQHRDRAAAAGGRRVLGRPRADRRPRLHPAVHRQLPHERRRSARLRRGASSGSAARSRADERAVWRATAGGIRSGPPERPDGALRSVEIEGRADLPRARGRGVGGVRRHLHPCQECSLAGGELDGAIVVCPCHGSEFDVRTGDVLSPPALEPLPIYRVRASRGAAGEPA